MNKKQNTNDPFCELGFYYYDSYVNDELKIRFHDIESPLTIFDFHEYCKRVALAIGYTESNVEEVFGPSETSNP